MKTSVIYSLFLLSFNASAVGAQDAAPKVLRGSSKIVAFEDYVKNNAQLDETQCLGSNSICVESLQCCSGFVCSGRLCRPDCGASGNFCTSGSQCCSGRCAGLVCTRSYEDSVEDVTQKLIEESHKAQIVKVDNVQEENEELVETQCTGTGRVCADSSQCCSGLVCSGNLCRPDCGGGGSLCFSNSDCCSGQCSGWVCRR